jgi:DNA mismatch repair ATPase MutL
MQINPLLGVNIDEKRRSAMNRKSSYLMLGACAGLLALSLSLGDYALSAGQESSSQAQKIESAKTRAEHEALAASYEQEAKSLQAKAEEHKQMGKAYSKIGHLKEKHNFVQHCDRLVEKYKDAARESLALAKLHRELAAKAQQ